MVTAKNLRKSNRRKKEKCFVCGEHEGIAELHHVLPCEECAFYINLLQIKSVKTPIVWLCPNHHMYIHKILKEPETIINFSATEREKIEEIISMRIESLKEVVQP